jgi:hypothetical protein
MGGQTHKTKAEQKEEDAAVLRRKCCSYARKQVAKLFDETSGDGSDHRTEFPCFEWSELVVGKVLGKGGFGTVREIKGFQLSAPQGKRRAPAPESAPETNDEHAASRRSTFMSAIHAPPPLIDDEVESGEFESRKFIADHCIRNGGDARYAVKILSPDTIQDTPKFLQGVMDLVIEARLLSSLEHPNIIKLRGLPLGDMFYEGTFLVLVSPLVRVQATSLMASLTHVIASSVNLGPTVRYAGKENQVLGWQAPQVFRPRKGLAGSTRPKVGRPLPRADPGRLRIIVRICACARAKADLSRLQSGECRI